MLLINEKRMTMPATIPFVPKSSTPSVCKTTREVYKLTSMAKTIRAYNAIVFFAMRLFAADLVSLCRFSSAICKVSLALV